MTDKRITRREFLEIAGGITFLSLIPTGRGAFAEASPTPGKRPLPTFTALPYVQPGNGSALIAAADTAVIAWSTEHKPADFQIEYGASKSYGQTVAIARAERWSGDKSERDARYKYAATLSGLELGKRYYYRVSGEGRVVAEGYFTTRAPRGKNIRFVAFGDNAFGEAGERAIAYYAYLQKPDFIMNTGDNVYESGLDNEYERYFFPVYNADEASPHIGAPILRSIPFYTVIANHDVHGKTPDGGPAADFAKTPDALAYYTAMHLPLNGPEKPTKPTPTVGDDARIAEFVDAAGPRFPRMANYSYDHGDAHFVCLDSNTYIDPTDAALQAWIESDLSSTDAKWKFVVFHHPSFNVGNEHYGEQQMRALCPLFEKHGVDIAFHGHEHVYQRTRPLLFKPTDLSKASAVGGKDRQIPGEFTIDRDFDGQRNLSPRGIIYITTGAGGKHLYDPGMDQNPTKWLHAEDNNADYVVQFRSDRHSFTVVDLDGDHLTLRQIDEYGDELDRIQVSKRA